MQSAYYNWWIQINQWPRNICCIAYLHVIKIYETQTPKKVSKACSEQYLLMHIWLNLQVAGTWIMTLEKHPFSWTFLILPSFRWTGEIDWHKQGGDNWHTYLLALFFSLVYLAEVWVGCITVLKFTPCAWNIVLDHIQIIWVRAVFLQLPFSMSCFLYFPVNNVIFVSTRRHMIERKNVQSPYVS